MDYFSESKFLEHLEHPVLAAISNNCFPFLLDRYFENDKNPYPLTYFLVLGSIEYRVISIY